MIKRAVIVEDEFFVANHLKKILVKNDFEVVAMYHDAESVLSNLNSLKDVIFILDIQLSSELDGVGIAKELNKRSIPFVFITANTESNTFNEAITTNPVSYISKPFKEFDVIAGISLAFNKLNNKILIDSGSERFYLDPEEVYYFKSDNVYVEVYLKNKTYTLRKQLKDIEHRFGQIFTRSHKSYLVNKTKITRIKSSTVYIGDYEVPLSRTYKHVFEEF
ncbi:LytR/AlgR family response regulator transcription factor [Brumimicrobium aurantiacum]|nr:response regulator transcription factor [Brumimicrobium aurantiacum]